MPLDITNLRKEYKQHSLDATDVHSNPIEQFKIWFKEAQEAQLPEPNAMVLATATPNAVPSARVVLLKEVTKEGFVFYTNYQSRKGRELIANPAAALVFNWLELERQIRIEGTVEKVDPATSTEYFQSRPKSSQIGAWASPQSQVIEQRADLEERVQNLSEKHQNTSTLPRPDHWGGFFLKPSAIEFWQGRPSRLHDRILYRNQSGDNWQIDRLAP